MLAYARSNQKKIAFDKTDICINLSTTFEETMGKTILESYIGKGVIANIMDFEILPKKEQFKPIEQMRLVLY